VGLRRKARELAVQTLYALDFSESAGEFVEYSMLNQYPDIMRELAEVEGIEPHAPVFAFAEDLVKNAIINIDDIRAEIEKHSDNWPFEDIAFLDRSILHIAVYEMLFTDTPAPVIINEAIEISKKYCSENTGKFLNGILDSIRRALKDEQSLQTPPRAVPPEV
jgi:N utilization substance protein B